MVDAANPEQLSEVADQLHAVIAIKNLARVPFAVLGNKCDLVDAGMSHESVL